MATGKYRVSFEEKEIVWNKYTVCVEASSEEVATAIVKEHCDKGTMHSVLNATFEEISEHIYLDGFDNEVVIHDDVVKISDFPSVEVNLSAFEIARCGKDAIYDIVQEKLQKVGICREVVEMTMTPIRIEDEEVVYDCQVTEFKKGEE